MLIYCGPYLVLFRLKENLSTVVNCFYDCIFYRNFLIKTIIEFSFNKKKKGCLILSAYNSLFIKHHIKERLNVTKSMDIGRCYSDYKFLIFYSDLHSMSIFIRRKNRRVPGIVRWYFRSFGSKIYFNVSKNKFSSPEQLIFHCLRSIYKNF